MPRSKQIEFPDSIFRILGLLGLLWAVFVLTLSIYFLIKMDTNLKVTPESRFVVVRENSIAVRTSRPSWADSIPAELITADGRTHETITRQTYTGPGEIKFYDYWPERDLHLRSTNFRNPMSGVGDRLEIKTPNKDWETLQSFEEIYASKPQFYEDPHQGDAIAYTISGPWSGEIWVQSLTNNRPIPMGEGMRLSIAPNRSLAVYITKRKRRADLLPLNPRYGFILWDIERQELKQIYSALIPDSSSGISLQGYWSNDSKFLRLRGIPSKSPRPSFIYSVEHDELYQMPWSPPADTLP